MKEIICSRCRKKVLVSDNWKYNKRCPKCREKDLVYLARLRTITKLNENSLSESLTKKYPQAKTFKKFCVWFKPIFKRNPSFDEFLRFKEEIALKESRERAHIEQIETRAQFNLEKIINEPKFPLVSADCRAYRLSRMKFQRSFSECASLTHVYKCQVCTAWLDWFKNDYEPREALAGDMSAFDSLNIGGNFWKGEPEELSPYRSKPLDKELDRKDFLD